MFKHIINEELELRLLKPRYAEGMYEVIDRNRDHLQKWFPWVELTTSPDNIREYIHQQLQRFATNGGFTAGIFCKGNIVGSISLHEINWKLKLTSIGYWLSSESQGSGIMTTCCKAVLCHGFETLGMNKIEIRARTDNVRSIAIPVRLGFKEEGVLRHVDFHNNEFHDHVVFGMLKEEWKKRRGNM